jgi:eukaryotic-like serine/threonine-protein kinase
MEALLCPSCGAATSEFDSFCASCGADLPAVTSTAAFDAPFEPRQISHYRLIRPLGRGGMGVVYLALDVELGREVAIKFLHQWRAARPADEARFRREAQATAALDHPNIGTIYEVGEHAGQRFLAMAFYDGTTLGQLLAAQPDRRLPVATAASIAGQLASALAAAHAAGIVHRDLKPENVMVLPDGRVKLLDFGLARRLDSQVLTEAGMAVGTAAYMAPEQIEGERSGTAADVWALGVVLYETLAGRRPFGGERQGLVHSILHEEPPPLREVRPETPAALERIVAHSLVKKPGGRWPAAADIVSELHSAGLWSSGSEGVRLPRRRRLRLRWIAAAAILLAAVAIAVFLLIRKPALPVYVAVLKPEIAGSLPPEDQAQVTANIQASLLRTIAALDGLAALDVTKVNGTKGPPVAVARALAAGEVIASRADCNGELCQVSLQRLSGRDGRVLGSEALPVSLSRPKLFADSVAAALRHAYGDRRLRVARLELEVQDEDYRTFFDLKRRINREGVSDDALARLDALRIRVPEFLEAAAFEAKVARRRYTETRDPRYLERGLAAIQDAIRIAPGDPRPLEARFDLDLTAGRLSEAESTLNNLEEIDPAGSLLLRGRLVERRGRPQEGLELMKAAIRLQPSWPNLLSLANAEYRQSRFDDARRHAEQLLARSPGNVDGLKMLAQIELLRNPERAVALLRQAAKSDPGADSLSNLGLNLMLLRHYAEAEDSLRKALALQPEDLDPALNLADCLTLLGRTAEAHQIYDHIVEVTSRSSTESDSHLSSVRAQALVHLGKTNQALEAIQRALRLNPDSGQLAYEAAVVYAVIGDRGSALFHVGQAAKHVDPNWFALPFFDLLRGDPAFRLLTKRGAS